MSRLSTTLVSDLNRGGVKAQRLATDQPLPKSGWLVRGIFTEVEQGSRILRSQVGFGAGATDLAVLVNVADLEKGKPESFYRLETHAGSGADGDRDEEPLCRCCEVRHIPARSAEERSADRTNYRRSNYSPGSSWDLKSSRMAAAKRARSAEDVIAWKPVGFWRRVARLTSTLSELGPPLCLKCIEFLRLIRIQIFCRVITKIGL
jgi:Domain of unknown function (DUF4410)